MRLESIYNVGFDAELQQLCEEYGKPYEAVKTMFNEAFDPYAYLNDVDSDEEIDPKDCLLRFGSGGNKKLAKMGTTAFSLPAGYTCPFADKCKSLAHRHGKTFSTGLKIMDKGDFRCYAASSEARFPNVRNRNWSNFDLLRLAGSRKAMYDLIRKSLDHHMHTSNVKIVRVHESGDFFSQDYFDAWMATARTFPRILFYAYTKSLTYWKKRKNDIPPNFNLIASEGGKLDELISKEDFRKAIVVTDKGAAIEQELDIDVDDFLAAFGKNDFAMLIHGTQSKDSGLNSTSNKNAKIIKDASRKMRLSPAKVQSLIDKYIDRVK